jgi:hypothetical protein
MLQVARVAPKILGDSAGLVREFLLGQQNADGGFKDRTGASDLYYTVFALDGLLALSSSLHPFPQKCLSSILEYLRQFESGEGLDFIHRCCLARCWAAVENVDGGKAAASFVQGDRLMNRIEACRSADEGYSVQPGAPAGTVYGAFLAVGACQDLQRPLINPEGLLHSVRGLEVEEGGWANDALLRAGSVPATAAAVTLLRHLNGAVPPQASGWLLAQLHPEGGFLAAPQAPMPDLLSTAVALHALSGLEADLDPVRESCIDFVDSLWVNDGGFYGNWSEDVIDCEYTYYGLLALGHLGL